MESEFEKLLNSSYSKERHFNKTIEGKIISITQKGEIYVDFGYKADGIIPFTDLEQLSKKEDFKIGQQIVADVVSWNDGFGNVLLSFSSYKKREDKRLYEIKKQEELQRKKQEQEKRQKEIMCFWEDAYVGKEYVGIVDNILDYGLFVKIGPKVGLLHKSEIVWDLKVNLKDMFSCGDEILVKIKSLDKEVDKISLAYPNKEVNPWIKKASIYLVGDIVTCTIDKFNDYGAVVKLENGLEGFISIGQITGTKRITKPQEALELGQKVNAKILNIDNIKNRISLSIKDVEGTSKEYGFEDLIGKTF